MREVALRRVVDDVLQRRIECRGAELHGERLVGFGRQFVEERRVDGGRLLADDARKRGALGAMAFAGGAQAAEQVNLQRRGLRQLVSRQLGGALIEVVRDPHRANRVRARRTRPHLVELVDGRHHRPLGLLHDVEILREVGGREPGGADVAWAAVSFGVGGAHPDNTATAPIIALRIMNARRSQPSGRDGAGCGISRQKVRGACEYRRRSYLLLLRTFVVSAVGGPVANVLCP